MRGATEIETTERSLATITGQHLMTLDLPEPPAVVDGLFVEGLTLLASRPKLGKSWMMLATAVAVASGGRALGKIPVQKGEVLYLALEDNQRRLQSRLEVITDTVPEGLHLATAGSMFRLYEGGLEQLDSWLTVHPKCRLVVVDTLARVRPRRRPGADLYEEDALLGAKLQELAVKHSIALVVVHHVRKAVAEDFLDTVSGSTGLTGVADAVLVLTRQRGEADAVLHVTGRDVEEAEHALSFDPSKGLWSLIGNAAVYARTKEQQFILEYLKLHPEGAAPKDVSIGTGLNRGSTRNMLAKLLADAVITKPKVGLYALSKKPDDSDDSKRDSASGTAQKPVIGNPDPKMTAMTDDTSCHLSKEAMTAVMTGEKPVRHGDTKSLSSLSSITVSTPLDLDKLEQQVNAGKFLNTPGFLGGVHRGNLEPALSRFVKRAVAGDREATLALSEFVGACA